MNSLLIFWICARNTASVLIGDDMDMKLKRCPFYNGRAKVFTAFGAKASCRQCGARAYDFDRAEAIAKWNRRCPRAEQDN